MAGGIHGRGHDSGLNSRANSSAIQIVTARYQFTASAAARFCCGTGRGQKGIFMQKMRAHRGGRGGRGVEGGRWARCALVVCDGGLHHEGLAISGGGGGGDHQPLPHAVQQLPPPPVPHGHILQGQPPSGGMIALPALACCGYMPGGQGIFVAFPHPPLPATTDCSSFSMRSLERSV